MVASTGTDPEGVESRLLAEFRPYLEESLILAILGDYELSTDHESARRALSQLSVDVEAEEASCYGPDVAGLAKDLEDGLSLQQRDALLPGSSASHPTDEESSRLVSSEAASRTTTSGDLSYPAPATSDAEGQGADIPNDEKEAHLCSMFPSIKPYDIKWELKQSGGDFDKALSALLNIQYLEETGQRPRGIDGAFDPLEDGGRPGKSKRKRKKGGQSSSEAAKANLGLNMAYTLKPADLVGVPASAPPTSAPTPALSGLIPRTPSNVSTVSLPSPVSEPTPTTTMGATAVDDGWQTVPTRKKPAGPLRLGDQASTQPPPTPSAATLRALAEHSFETAHSAYRKGKSNPLLFNAAVVYAERGHAQMAAVQDLSRAESVALVDSQSTERSVDLHGVPVVHGVEIALERCRAWWRAVSDSEEGTTRAAKRSPLVIVTGQGNHSAGGVSKMRQAVLPALSKEGWAVQVETGQFVVSGRSKTTLR